ncbi:ribonuclease H1 [Diplogelasinospora grovesii]|uniref:Ribonuclease H1 n=1 Tax=Diplogelasinospora grovesii TaxID=303347 RepID=A0AAN6NH55_9PEZI|nr:ribonuclease H1 [Diplogelasinospora grovesii]
MSNSDSSEALTQRNFVDVRAFGIALYDARERESRLFDPLSSPRHDRVPRNRLIAYNRRLEVSHFRENNGWWDDSTLIVRIGGACRDNGGPRARGAWGVYFGSPSQYNANGRLSPDIPQTNARADIESLWQALNILSSMNIVNGVALRDDIHDVRILTNSQYLVNAMAKWMPGWIENGGRRPNGGRVRHFATLKAINDRLDEMSSMLGGKLNIKFMYFPVEGYDTVGELARSALD